MLFLLNFTYDILNYNEVIILTVWEGSCVKNKISYKLILYIFLISFVVSALSVYLQVNKQYSNQIAQFNKNVNDIKKDQIPIITRSLWNMDTEIIKILLDNLIRNDYIVYAKIVEINGNIIAAGNDNKSKTIKKEFILNYISDNKKHTIGTLTIFANLNPIYTKLKNNIVFTIFTETIKMLLISLFIIFIIKNFLTNRLEEITHYADKLSLDNLDKELKIKETSSKNELDVLTDSINAMRINLIEQITQNEDRKTLLTQQSKMVSMGEMIGNIAHQWRQPLSIISTASTGIKLQKEFNTLKDEDLYQMCDAINNNAQYLSKTIDDFKNFIKGDRTKEIFNLSNNINSFLNLVEGTIKNNNINIILNLQENIKIDGYENELIQCLINIFNNAKDVLKNICDKSDSTSCHEDNKYIFINTNTKGDTAVIKIKDSGGGIPADVLPYIFEPYFTTKHKSQGTGLGLHMTYNLIVDGMNGTIEANNLSYEYDGKEYVGAEFTIKLPLE